MSELAKPIAVLSFVQVRIVPGIFEVRTTPPKFTPWQSVGGEILVGFGNGFIIILNDTAFPTQLPINGYTKMVAGVITLEGLKPVNGGSEFGS